MGVGMLLTSIAKLKRKEGDEDDWEGVMSAKLIMEWLFLPPHLKKELEGKIYKFLNTAIFIIILAQKELFTTAKFIMSNYSPLYSSNPHPFKNGTPKSTTF